MSKQAKQILGFILAATGFAGLIALVMLWDKYGAWVWLIPVALALIVVVLGIRYQSIRLLAFGGLDALGEWSKNSSGERLKERRKIPKDIQRQVRERANNVCEHPDCNRKTRNHFHHIDENPSHNVRSNILYICPNHHDDAHRGILTPTEQHRWARRRPNTSSRPRDRRTTTRRRSR